MELVDFILHVDKHLLEFVQNYGTWVYGLLFLIIFVETGLIVMPFLPGDSLLFVAGALCANDANNMNVGLLLLLLFVAAVLGDTVNYLIGRFFGQKIVEMKLRFVKQEHLDKANLFYEKHGGKAIIYARFMPIVRTFAPFVAGIGSMNYKKFITFNIVGGAIWIFSFLFLGYFFGNLPFVKSNLKLILLGIIILSITPPILEMIKEKMNKKA